MPQLQLLFFIFLRIGAIVLTAPVFDSPTIPVLFKAGLAFAVSLLLMPLLNLESVAYQPGLLPFMIGALSEVIMGLMIGMLVRMVFAGVVSGRANGGLSDGVGHGKHHGPRHK
jgi:flagellar biosynthetic protein FliR